MRFILKLLAGLIAFTIVAVVGASVYLYMNGQALIKDGVQEYGPDITGTSVTLSRVHFSPLNGNAAVKDLSIGSPKGFSAPYTIKVKAVDIDLEPRSVLSDTLVIHQLFIDRPAIIYEQNRDGSNLDALQKNIETFASSFTRTQENDATQPLNVAIGELLIKGAQLQFLASDFGLGDGSVELADIRLTDIGVHQGGVPPSEVARLTMKALMPQIGKALASAEGRKLLQNVLGDRLNLDQSLKEQAKDAVKDKAKDRLKGLLGNKNE